MAEKNIKTKTATKTAGSKTASKSAAARRTPTKAPAKTSASKPAAKSAKKKTTFKLRAPEATQVTIAGCFNDWDATENPLTQGDGGMWTCSLMLEPGEHEYRFVVDGAWCDDPMAEMRRPNEFGCENCVIMV
jgi:1,4-alpha-glucan branching enzyme